MPGRKENAISRADHGPDAFIPARTAARIEEQTGRGVNRVIFCPPLKEIVSAPPAPIVKQEYVGSLVFLA
jgi:hypothetical protein